MTQVIRIVLSLSLTAFVVVSLTETSDAQIFRRWRQATPAQPQVQRAPVQRAPVQRAPQQVAPRPVYQQQPQVRLNQSGQTLTPYARTTPQQRLQASPTPVANAQTSTATVQVVTYYDPQTGRSYQRRYVVPSNQPALTVGNQQRQVTSKPATVSQFNIPPIQPAQSATTVVTPVNSSELLPTLAGPSAVTATPTTSALPSSQIIRDPNVLPTAGTQAQANPIETSLDSGDSSNAGAEAVYSVLDQTDPTDDPTEQANELELAAPEASEAIPSAAPAIENDQPIVIEPPSEEPPSEEPELEISSPDDVDAFFGSTE